MSLCACGCNQPHDYGCYDYVIATQDVHWYCDKNHRAKGLKSVGVDVTQTVRPEPYNPSTYTYG